MFESKKLVKIKIAVHYHCPAEVILPNHQMVRNDACHLGGLDILLGYKRDMTLKLDLVYHRQKWRPKLRPFV